MNLVLADELNIVRAKYIEVIENTPDIKKHARWVYGQHPTDMLLQSYIDNHELYLLMDGDITAGMVALVMHQGKDYEAVDWTKQLANDDVATLHLLAVCPDYRGRGLADTIIDESIAISKANGKKSLRLDTLKTNLPAQHIYEKYGFKYRGTQHLYAKNTGWTDFLFYEYDLE